jgi:hypothetical protein
MPSSCCNTNIKTEYNDKGEINNIRIIIYFTQIKKTLKFIVNIKGIYYDNEVDLIYFIGKNQEKRKINKTYKEPYILILLEKVANNIKISVQFVCLYSKQLLNLGEFVYLHNFVDVINNIVDGYVVNDDMQNFYMSVVKPIEEAIINA